MNAAEPKPEAGIPKPPPGLRPAAAAVWRRMARTLDRMGVLTCADGEALARLCDCLADLEAARASYERPMTIERVDPATDEIQVREIAAAGQPTYVSVGKDGTMLRTRPELALIAEIDRRVRGYLADFGLTPAARTKVKVAEPKRADPLAAYYSG